MLVLVVIGYWVCLEECGVLAIGSCLEREGLLLFFFFFFRLIFCIVACCPI